MAIKHHPDISTLITCAAGSQPEVLCAVVASHLSICGSCLAKVSRLERIGVEMFESLVPVPLQEGVRRKEAPVGRSMQDLRLAWSTETGSGNDIPGPLTPLLGTSSAALDWRPLLTGVEEFVVPLSEDAIGDLRLLRVDPGLRVHWKTDEGEGLVLLLGGGYANATRTFEPGDFDDLDEAGAQLIVSDHEHGCVVMLANEAVPEFSLKPF